MNVFFFFFFFLGGGGGVGGEQPFSIAKLNYELNNTKKGVRGSKITHINDKGSRYYHSQNQ